MVASACCFVLRLKQKLTIGVPGFDCAISRSTVDFPVPGPALTAISSPSLARRTHSICCAVAFILSPYCCGYCSVFQFHSTRKNGRTHFLNCFSTRSLLLLASERFVIVNVSLVFIRNFHNQTLLETCFLLLAIGIINLKGRYGARLHR